MTTLLTILEVPGIAVGLVLGIAAGSTGGWSAAHGAVGKVVRSKSMVLHTGGLAIGFVTGDAGWATVASMFDTKRAISRRR